ncbi:MAG: complex I NDUFA9 subunit family protein [Pseudomonadota bacterium]
MAYNGKLVTVFGGSGFVGRYVCGELAKRGYRVRAAVRRPDLAQHLQPLAPAGQIQAVQANLRYRWSVDRAVEGADHVINLVAILAESGKQTFDAVQAFGARAVAEACREKGVGLTHVSAIGADVNSRADYGRTKGEAEQAVIETVPSANIIRPSIIFGAEDAFFNRFAKMATLSPIIPLIGAGTKFQPVYVDDVAKAIVNAMEASMASLGQPGKIYEVGGPEVKTFRELIEQMLTVINRKPGIANIPFPIAMLQGKILGLLPNAPITADQVEMLKTDNIVSADAKAENRTLSDLGVSATSLASVLPNYLYVYRDKGQYADNLD